MFVSRGYIKGICRIFNYNGSGKAHNDYSGGMQKDCEALRGDWVNVGQDIRRGIRKFEGTAGEIYPAG